MLACLLKHHDQVDAASYLTSQQSHIPTNLMNLLQIVHKFKLKMISRHQSSER